MARFIRFDMRAPAWGPASADELHQASLDMAEWADRVGFDSAVVSEHHCVEDGFLPAPIVAASAIAGRTRRIGISISCLIAPLHDPIRVAEDLAVLDLMSAGRVTTVVGLGYRPEEYAMFDIDWDGRGAYFEQCVAAMLEAWKGEPFEYEGRPVHVTPSPVSTPHPLVFMGGRSNIAARRAARLDLPFFPDSDNPEFVATYEQACRDEGREPGLVITPHTPVTFLYVAEDPEEYWAAIVPHLLHEATIYKGWQRKGEESSVVTSASTIDDLKAGETFTVLTPEDAVAHCREREAVMLYPLCGGIAPSVAWESLDLIEHAVLPEL